jgi:carboxypeptidase C (cathepsin A)
VKEDATTKGTFTITERAQSWNKQAHLLFIDQPFNSGYSYTNSKTPVKDSRTAAKYFTDFLK